MKTSATGFRAPAVGCQQTFGNVGTTTEWFYSPQTVDDAKVTCTDASATYVARRRPRVHLFNYLFFT